MAKHPSSETQTSTETTTRHSHPDFSPQWCQTLLNDPSYQDAGSKNHNPNPTSPTFNVLMNKTLSTPSTLRAIHYLYRPPQPQDFSSPSLPDSPKRVSGDLIALISLGAEMCSYPNTLHGGINAVLVDEVGGALVMREAPEGVSMMAVNLNVNLRKSVKTPGVVVGRAWREREVDGRKWWVRCVLEQDGVRCIEAECLYLQVSIDKSKL